MEHNQYITWRRTCQGYTAERTKKEIRHKQHISFCLRLCPNAQKRAHGFGAEIVDRNPTAYFAYVPTQA